MEFPLSRAPEMFFDPQLWGTFVSYFETPETAYERIGYPPDFSGYHDENYATRSNISKERWQEIEEADTLGRELLRGLRSRFLSEELSATGLPAGVNLPTRLPIPPTEWLKLWPNFAGNWAMSTTGRYDDVRLLWRPKDRKAEIQSLCEEFLRKRQCEGETRKKILMQEVVNFVGENVPTRIFDAVYQGVFKKRRGRPRREK